MINRLLHIHFLLPFFLFCLHQLLQKALLIKIPLFDQYLDPFCLSAIALPLYSLERKFLFRQQQLSKLEVMMVLGFLSFASEFLLPKLFNEFKADLIDVLMIFLGGIWYWKLSPSGRKY